MHVLTRLRYQAPIVAAVLLTALVASTLVAPNAVEAAPATKPPSFYDTPTELRRPPATSSARNRRRSSSTR
jgi:hypothetical protein